jgi:hypothetical protein
MDMRGDLTMDDDGRAQKERRKRNVVLAVSLVALGVLIYLMSLVQWHEHFG